MDNTQLHIQMENYTEAEVNRKLKLRLRELELALMRLYPADAGIITDIVTKYSYPVTSTLRLDIEKKTRKKRELPIEMRCEARTGNNTQCRRPKGSGNIYCLSHQHTLPHGNINKTQPLTERITGKRGRKKKNKEVFKTEDLDKTKYIQAVLVEIGDTPYLVDENHIIYKYGGDNIIVGHINGDSDVCWL